jgi:hypothetical protein
MKITEIIDILTAIKEKEGDLNCVYYDGDDGIWYDVFLEAEEDTKVLCKQSRSLGNAYITAGKYALEQKLPEVRVVTLNPN